MKQSNIKYNLNDNEEYKLLLKEIKTRIRNTQIKAVVNVNTELLRLYWSIGEDLVSRQKKTKWGDGFLNRLSQDLMAEFPEMKGFSQRNLKYIRQWFLFYIEAKAFGQQVVAQITQIPWGHNIVIITK